MDIQDLAVHLTALVLQSILTALQYLMWESTAVSVKVLDAVHHICKKADVHMLYQLAPVCSLLMSPDALYTDLLSYAFCCANWHQATGLSNTLCLVCALALSVLRQLYGLFTAMQQSNPVTAAGVSTVLCKLMSPTNAPGRLHKIQDIQCDLTVPCSTMNICMS